MTKTRMLLYLENSFATFSLSESNLADLARSFPQLEIELVKSEGEFAAGISDAEIAASWSFPVELYAKATRLVALYTPSAGREHVALDPRGKVKVHFGSFHGELIAETLLGLVLYFNRQLAHVLANQREGIWEREYLARSPRLGSQHLLIIGFGNVGRACARLFRGFGCRITGVRRSPRDERLDRDADAVLPFSSLSAVLSEADHVVAILPSDTGTDRIITREHFRAMKRSAYFYNLGRGNCYAEEELVAALRTGLIAGAGLDVFAQEPLPRSSDLWKLPNVVLLPHASPLYPDYMDLFVREMKEDLRLLLSAR